MQPFWRAEAGDLDPFVLVIEGSIPNEEVKAEGYWAGFGNNAPGPSRFSDQPMKTTEWIDRLAPKALAVVAAGTCASGAHDRGGAIPRGAVGASRIALGAPVPLVMTGGNRSSEPIAFEEFDTVRC